MRSRWSVALALALAGVVIGGCGSSKKSSHTNTSAMASAEAQIKHNWVEFFNPSTSTSTRIALLQNGSKFAPVIAAQSKSSLAKQSAATVSAVKLSGPSSATVTYTVTLAGQPVPGLKNTTGMAIKSGSTWQVSDASFCRLLKLEGSAPPACPKA